MRLDGVLYDTDHDIFDPETTQRLLYSILDNEQIARFEKNWELDLSFGIQGLGRFRTNVFLQRGAVGGVLRVIPYEIKCFKDLGLPEHVCKNLLQYAQRISFDNRVHRQWQINNSGFDA